MKLLHITHSMNPEYGGVSSSINSLAAALEELGHRSTILSLDDPLEPFIGQNTAPITALGPSRSSFGYCPRLGPWLDQHSRDFDALIVHGLWQYHGFAVWRSHRRNPLGPDYFVFSHGMLDPWFNREHPKKHAKKWIYWWLAERRVLRDAKAVLFTCAREKQLARTSFPRPRYQEAIVALGTRPPPDNPAGQSEAFLTTQPILRRESYWLYLGRIHPKKGVRLLIDAYAALVARGIHLPYLVVAGPCADPAYLRDLKAAAAAGCPDGRILWPGMLNGEAKWGALREADAFVLPSHQENFGIAVVEAMACGTAVLISDQVNIAEDIVSDRAGMSGPDTTEGTIELLERWLRINESERDAMSQAAHRSFELRYTVREAAHSLLQQLGSPKPRQFSP